MVCASIEEAGKIAGGFVLVPVASLMAAWRACRGRPLGIGDFRAWLACRELEARRCKLGDDRAPAFGFAELAGLLGVSEKRARASVRRLVDLELIERSRARIAFLGPDGPADALLDTIGRGRGSIAIPRRMLRFLAGGATAPIIATVIALLLRCLSRRKAGWDGRGRVKASWVAKAYGVDLRRVKAARRELVALGWIDPEPSGQRAENRWGRAYRIDLAWDRPKAVGRDLPPLPAGDRSAIATPSVDQEPSLTGGDKDQEPGPEPSGFSVEGQGGGAGAATTQPDRPPVMLIAAQASPALCSGPAAIPSPRLADVRTDDLKDTGRLLDLHRQAVARGLVTASEADRLRFVAAAEHALAIASHPAALFAWLVLNGCWRYITGTDEDSARRRLRAHDFGPSRVAARSIPPASTPSRPIEPGGLSEDALIVREVRAACIRAGIYRDPWPAFSSKNPGWDRGRWGAALGELGLG